MMILPEKDLKNLTHAELEAQADALIAQADGISKKKLKNRKIRQSKSCGSVKLDQSSSDENVNLDECVSIHDLDPTYTDSDTSEEHEKIESQLAQIPPDLQAMFALLGSDAGTVFENFGCKIGKRRQQQILKNIDEKIQGMRAAGVSQEQVFNMLLKVLGKYNLSNVLKTQIDMFGGEK